MKSFANSKEHTGLVTAEHRNEQRLSEYFGCTGCWNLTGKTPDRNATQSTRLEKNFEHFVRQRRLLKSEMKLNRILLAHERLLYSWFTAGRWQELSEHVERIEIWKESRFPGFSSGIKTNRAFAIPKSKAGRRQTFFQFNFPLEKNCQLWLVTPWQNLNTALIALEGLLGRFIGLIPNSLSRI